MIWISPSSSLLAGRCEVEVMLHEDCDPSLSGWCPFHPGTPGMPGDGAPPWRAGISTGRDGDGQTAAATSGRPSRGRLPLDNRGDRTALTGDSGPPPAIRPASPRSHPSLDRGLPPDEGFLEGEGAPRVDAPLLLVAGFVRTTLQCPFSSTISRIRSLFPVLIPNRDRICPLSPTTSGLVVEPKVGDRSPQPIGRPVAE